MSSPGFRKNREIPSGLAGEAELSMNRPIRRPNNQDRLDYDWDKCVSMSCMISWVNGFIPGR